MPRIVRAFLRDERGALTSLGLLLLVTFFALGGLAVDVANAVRVGTELQVAADAAAHAALYTRSTADEAEARDAALKIAASVLPAEQHGTAIVGADIVFGTWDAASRSFQPDPASKAAVSVTTRRQGANGVATYLLDFAGVASWDLQRAAVFETYQPACLREGFVAKGRVDMQSNNDFYNGFCIHSNDHVEFNQNNSFETGVTVSMPDANTLVIPASGFDKNEGLEDALREGTMNLRVLDHLPEIIADLGSFGSEVMPEYIGVAGTVTLSTSTVDGSHFQPGKIHSRTCGSGGTLQIAADTVLTDLVLVTDCSLQFGSGVRLENVVIATTSTASDSVTAASGLQIGRNDDCAEDGGAQILTLGDMRVPAKMAIFGGQIIAAGNIEFAAQADGIEGASLIAGGEIDGTSNATMGFCGSGMEGNIEVPYFRLVS